MKNVQFLDKFPSFQNRNYIPQKITEPFSECTEFGRTLGTMELGIFFNALHWKLYNMHEIYSKKCNNTRITLQY